MESLTTNAITKTKIFYILLAFLCQSCFSLEATEEDTLTIIGVGEKATIIRSEDGGATWKRATVPGASREKDYKPVLLKDAVFGNQTWVAVGGIESKFVKKTSILYSEDDGVTWQEAKLAETTAQLNAIAYYNKTFVAVGNHQTVLKSVDGKEWKKIEVNTLIPDDGDKEKRNLLKVTFNLNNIVIAGTGSATIGDSTYATSLILESSDGGATWATVPDLTNKGITGLASGHGDVIAITNGYAAYNHYGVWEADQRKFKPKVYGPCIRTNDTFVALTKSKNYTKLAFYEYSDWRVVGNSIYNMTSYDLIDGNGYFVLVGNEKLKGKGYSGHQAAIYTADKRDCVWKSTSEGIDQELKSVGAKFRSGIFANNKFIIVGDVDNIVGSRSYIYYTPNGYSWKRASVTVASPDENILKLVKQDDPYFMRDRK